MKFKKNLNFTSCTNLGKTWPLYKGWYPIRSGLFYDFFLELTRDGEYARSKKSWSRPTEPEIRIIFPQVRYWPKIGKSEGGGSITGGSITGGDDGTHTHRYIPWPPPELTPPRKAKIPRGGHFRGGQFNALTDILHRPKGVFPCKQKWPPPRGVTSGGSIQGGSRYVFAYLQGKILTNIKNRVFF